jgi:hypothetical protein
MMLWARLSNDQSPSRHVVIYVSARIPKPLDVPRMCRIRAEERFLDLQSALAPNFARPLQVLQLTCLVDLTLAVYIVSRSLYDR